MSSQNENKLSYNIWASGVDKSTNYAINTCKLNYFT